MTYEEFCLLANKNKHKIPEENLKLFNKELKRAKLYYENGRDLYNELLKDKPKAETPLMFALEFCESIGELNPKMVQVSSGASGGI
jgi:hypothetical protein